MGQVQIETNLEGIHGLCLVTPAIHRDARGYFMETWNERDLFSAGIRARFVQDNQSLSTRGTLRGLHYQKRHPQAKLIRVAAGAVFDVAVDLRQGSPTLGRWYGTVLSDENRRQLFIPEGFAHGFLTLSEKALLCYKVTDFWHADDEAGLAWNSPALAIRWPKLQADLPYLLSDKDKAWPAELSDLPLKEP